MRPRVGVCAADQVIVDNNVVEFGAHASDQLLVRDGAQIIIHNNGASMSGSMACTIRSPKRVCFGYNFELDPDFRFTVG